MDGVLTRFVIALVIVGAGIAAYWAVGRAVLWRARNRRAGLESLRAGVPAILYFTSPGCRPCETFQRPALEGLKRRLGDKLDVIEVDVSLRPGLADYWGVLSIPTTFVIDRHGRPRRVNHGVAGREKLLQQLVDVNEGWLPAHEPADASAARQACGD